MKRTPLGVAAVTPCLFATWCSAICLAAFLTTTPASAVTDSQTSAHGLSPAERWVVERVTAGDQADLNAALNADHTKKFSKEDDRKVSARFLEDLLTGTLPGV